MPDDSNRTVYRKNQMGLKKLAWEEQLITFILLLYGKKYTVPLCA
jgi:hypothetical protein